MLPISSVSRDILHWNTERTSSAEVYQKRIYTPSLPRMGACASKRTKSKDVEEVQQKYDILASLFATRAQDLSNIVTEYDASRKAEAMAYEEVTELKEQMEEMGGLWELERQEWRVRLDLKDEEMVAYQRVVDMRTEERDMAREEAAALRTTLIRLGEAPEEDFGVRPTTGPWLDHIQQRLPHLFLGDQSGD